MGENMSDKKTGSKVVGCEGSLTDVSKPAPDISKCTLEDKLRQENSLNVEVHVAGEKMLATVSAGKFVDSGGMTTGVSIQTASVYCPSEKDIKKMSEKDEVFKALADSARLNCGSDKLECVEATQNDVFKQCVGNYAAASQHKSSSHRK